MQLIVRLGVIAAFLIGGGILLQAVDIYVSPFQLVSRVGETASNREITDDELSLAAEFLKDLAAYASENAAYKPLPVLSPASLKILNRNMVLTKLEASVVCYYDQINYVLYGTIANAPDTDAYTASLALYEKKSNSLLKQWRFTDQAASREAFVKKLAPVVSKDVAIIVPKSASAASTEPPRAEDRPRKTEETTPPVVPEKKTEEQPAAVKTEEMKAAAPPEKTAETPAPRKERPLGLFVQGGHHFIFQHEWLNAINPLVAGELGAKYELALYDSADLDFSLRVGGFLCYSFSNNKPDVPYISFHTLKAKATAEAYLQFSELFAVYAGGGPLYCVDIIDYQNMSHSFFTQRAMALGFHALLGVELTFNDERTFGIGVVNSLDMTLFAATYLEYNLMFVLIFKV